MPELKIMKAPSELAILEDVRYPTSVSLKLDGIRCLVKDGEVYSASMRPLPNIQLRTLLKGLIDKPDYVFDGEIYAHNLVPEEGKTQFGTLYGICMAHDREIPKCVKLHLFDCLPLDEWNEKKPSTVYKERYKLLRTEAKGVSGVTVVTHHNCKDIDAVNARIEAADADGYEGLMIRDWNGAYKHGRSTLKQGTLLKVKFWVDFDGQITEVEEGWKNKEGIERTIDPTGHKTTVTSKDDKDRSGSFGRFKVQVDIPGRPTMNIGGWKGLTDVLRDEIWADKKSYVGRWIRFRSMKAGQKDVPRIPRDVEFRDDKEFEHA